MINERAWAMAQIVKLAYSFVDKNVVDFGCGYGDMMYHALDAGAARAIGVEQNEGIAEIALQKCKDFPDVEMLYGDVEDPEVQVDLDVMGYGDVAFCFSVLPYLKHPDWFVGWLGDHFANVFIECQYRGDGPGNIASDDDEMSVWLLNHFDNAMLIGRTHVLARDKYRSIWKCFR